MLAKEDALDLLPGRCRFSAMATGSSTMSRIARGARRSGPTVETPSIAEKRRHEILASGDLAQLRWGRHLLTGPMVATTMGWLLKSNELTCGVAALRQVQLGPPACSTSRERLLDIGAE